ncbi:MAG: helix-turn-helix domain-containing protein [Armatimonadetes bacterium]|nr:helix-turn-helix domain-containing protein [Armatimonadota bacterium]
MSAHEWTRARQRSVRREAQPAAEPSPIPPPLPLEPDEPLREAPAAPVLVSHVEEPAPVELAAEPYAEPAPPEPEPMADVVPLPPPTPPSPAPTRRPPRRRQQRPVARQAELPLGLEPVSEAAAYRSATETREELIERLLDPHLSLQETAKLLGVCPTTVRRYTNRGLLAHYRTPGNQRRFRLSDVLAFMERQGIPAHGLERKRAPLWTAPEPIVES